MKQSHEMQARASSRIMTFFQAQLPIGKIRLTKKTAFKQGLVFNVFSFFTVNNFIVVVVDGLVTVVFVVVVDLVVVVDEVKSFFFVLKTKLGLCFFLSLDFFHRQD